MTLSLDGYYIPVVYEDADLLVVDKPSGLPTQATVDRRRANLYDLLLKSNRWAYVGLHHRLDAPTSGLVLLTKSKKANKPVAELFRERGMRKTYHCLVSRKPETVRFEIRNHLKAVKERSGKTKMRSTASGGDYAETEFYLEAEGEKVFLLRAHPKTGRMHQIRVHLAEANFPILGDTLYGQRDDRFARVMLHASGLIFAHPISQKPMEINCPLPKDFAPWIPSPR